MGCRILAGTANGNAKGACFYDSVTDWCFGPLMKDEQEALAFMKWLDCDPRILHPSILSSKYAEFITEKEW